MNVVPDLVALPNPKIDLSVSFPSVSDPVPGDYLLPSQVSCLFHISTIKYSLLTQSL